MKTVGCVQNSLGLRKSLLKLHPLTSFFNIGGKKIICFLCHCPNFLVGSKTFYEKFETELVRKNQLKLAT